MGSLAGALLLIVFVTTLVYPPLAAITVPGASLIWIVAYLSRSR